MQTELEALVLKLNTSESDALDESCDMSKSK